MNGPQCGERVSIELAGAGEDMRLALRVEYRGTRYCGWETQRHDTAVQAVLEEVLSQIADQPVATVCAGRTDARVHAFGQIVHFDTNAERPLRAWTLGCNAKLPPDISVTWADEVAEDFHARFSARERRYRYLIFNSTVRSALRAHQVAWVHRPLALEPMQAAARHLLGRHDFSAFRAAGCQAKNPVRTIRALRVWQRGELIGLDVAANAFLQHMVRNIAGTLMEVGQGKRAADSVAEVLAACDRTLAGPTASPDGLYFLGPVYPRRFGIPSIPRKLALW